MVVQRIRVQSAKQVHRHIHQSNQHERIVRPVITGMLKPVLKMTPFTNSVIETVRPNTPRNKVEFFHFVCLRIPIQHWDAYSSSLTTEFSDV